MTTTLASSKYTKHTKHKMKKMKNIFLFKLQTSKVHNNTNENLFVNERMTDEMTRLIIFLLPKPDTKFSNSSNTVSVFFFDNTV